MFFKIEFESVFEFFYHGRCDNGHVIVFNISCDGGGVEILVVCAGVVGGDFVFHGVGVLDHKMFER